VSKYQDTAVKVTTVERVLRLLKEGNERFVANSLIPTDYPRSLGKKASSKVRLRLFLHVPTAAVRQRFSSTKVLAICLW